MSEKEEIPETLEKVKPKAPRSEKQLEAFKRAQQIRKENCELMKEVKEQQEAQRKLEQIKIKEEILKKKAKVAPEPESEDDEPEIVIVKKQKKKKIVVVEPESDEEQPGTALAKQCGQEPAVEKVKPLPVAVPQVLPEINKLSFY